MRKALWSLAFGSVVVAAWAAQATVDLTAFPSVSVADGRSTVTISATLRTRDGQLVPDGTRVVFAVDRGTFREPIVETRNGIARAILQTGTEAGFAKVTVSALTYQTTATLDYEYVKDRALLSTANEYIEVNSPTDLRYSMDLKTIEATSGEGAAVVTYRDIEIRAEQIQVSVPTYEVRAKNAVVKVGGVEWTVGQLYYKLNQRVGFGTTTYKYRPLELKPAGDSVVLVEGEERETYGVAELKAGEARKPSGQINDAMFAMKDIGDSASLIAAKKAIAYPRKEVQFQKADIYVGGARIMRVPLFKVDVYSNSPIITDQMVKINENSVAVDYPYYLDLAPGRSSLVRFALGGSGQGRGISGRRGIYLSYEYNWSRGDEMMGNFTLNSLGRTDWGVSATQYWRLDERTDLNVQLDLPAHRSLFGNVNFGRQFDGFSFRVSAQDSRNIDGGTPFRNQQAYMSVDTDPIKMGKLPLTMSYGVSGNLQSSSYGSETASQRAFGARALFRMSPIYLTKQTSLTGSLNLGKNFGPGSANGLTTLGSLTLSQAMAGGGVALSYDYVDDGFNSGLLGRHQLSARANYSQGAMDVNLYGARSLDIDRTSLQLDASYRFSPLWRLSSAYTYDRYLSDSFLDYYFVLGYRVGFREFGLTWSYRTKRIGFQVLGSTLY